MILLVVFFGAVVLMKINNKKIAPTNLSPSTDFTIVPENTALSGRIYFVSYKDGSEKINYYDVKKNETKEIFDDKSEDYKINDFGNFAELSSEFIVYLQNGDHGQLATFQLGDKLTKNILRDNFLKPESFAFDATGKTIYYSLASIDPTSKMHSLYSETRDGKNQRLIYQTEFPILNIQVINDSSRLLFTENDKMILSLDLANLKTTEIFSTSGKIYEMSLIQKNNVIFTEVKDNLNAGTVFSLNLKNNEVKKVLSLKSSMPSSAIMSSDILATALIQKKFSEKYDKMLSGELSLIKIGSEKINNIGSGMHVIYWEP